MRVRFSNETIIKLRTPSPNRPAINSINNNTQREQQYDIGDLASLVGTNEQLLSNEQTVVYDRVMFRIASRKAVFSF